MKSTIFAMAAVSAISAAGWVIQPAAAATPPSVIRGTIDSISGSTMMLTERDGSKATITLAANAKVTDLVPSSLAQVKSGSYIGTAAVKEPNGQYRAMELQVFPEAMRGVGQGTRPWNLTKKSSMTNGTVGSMTQTNGTVGNVSNGGDLTLTVNDGSGTKTVLVPSTVPVVTYQPGAMADLTPGAHVILFAQKGSDGTWTSSRVNVGKNGLVPPM